MGFQWVYIKQPSWQKLWREDVMSDKTKVKMTRAEAIASLQKHCPVDDPAAIIDFYIEAGMLEVVEEPAKSYVPLGFQFPFKNYESWAECCKALHDQGWNIIKWR